VNIASERVFSKLGFQIEGVYKDHFWLEDRFVDSVRVAKLTDTFL
jgi:RimJ/RimL family protein N-acetyltransferase